MRRIRGSFWPVSATTSPLVFPKASSSESLNLRISIALSSLSCSRDLALLALNSASDSVYSAFATADIALRSSALSPSHSLLLMPNDSALPGSWKPRPLGYDDVDLAMDQLCGEAWETLVIALCPPILDQNVLPFDVSAVPKA